MRDDLTEMSRDHLHVFDTPIQSNARVAYHARRHHITAAEIADNPDHLADDDLAVGYNLLALDYRQLAWEILARLTKLHPPDPWTRP